jgi:type IV pilus assembly protein PilM
MFSRFHSRTSAITFDVGAAGIRAHQAAARGAQLARRDSLRLELPPAQLDDDQGIPPPDYSRLARLVGQGNFTGSEVGLVLSAPEVRFCALRLPKNALTQSEHRVRQALAWEVAREMRADAGTLEVRYWHLPPGHHQGLNVMAVALPIEQALTWHELLARDRLRLRRIDVSPCGLVHLASRIWTPADNELWGVLDLGFRRTTLTVVLGRVPAYIRSLPVSSNMWTRRVAEGFEVTHAAAERIKRTHGIQPGERGVRPPKPDQTGPGARDTPGVVFGLLRELLDDLTRQINRCFAYVLQNFSDVAASRLLLAGGGANLRGLAEYLELQLDVSVMPLASSGAPAGDAPGSEPATDYPQWERPLPDTGVRPESAAAVGAALLDLEEA